MCSVQARITAMISWADDVSSAPEPLGSELPGSEPPGSEAGSCATSILMDGLWSSSRKTLGGHRLS